MLTGFAEGRGFSYGSRVFGMSTFQHFSQETTSEEVGKEFASEIRNKVVLITGATYGGIGVQTAKVIAQNGAKLVILAGRSQQKLDEAITIIESEAPEANLRPLILDLASFDAVRKAAAQVNNYAENVDVLINNAAVLACPFSKTVDGIESQFATTISPTEQNMIPGTPTDTPKLPTPSLLSS
jgi:hypothetical protein